MDAQKSQMMGGPRGGGAGGRGGGYGGGMMRGGGGRPGPYDRMGGPRGGPSGRGYGNYGPGAGGGMGSRNFKSKSVFIYHLQFVPLALNSQSPFYLRQVFLALRFFDGIMPLCFSFSPYLFWFNCELAFSSIYILFRFWR